MMTEDKQDDKNFFFRVDNVAFDGKTLQTSAPRNLWAKIRDSSKAKQQQIVEVF